MTMMAGSQVRCVGVDVSASIVDRARALHPQVTAFEVADAWDLAALQRVARRHLAVPPASLGAASDPYSVDMDGQGEGMAGPELLLLDVGGLSGAHGELDTLALIRSLASAFSPTLNAIVVKSLCLRTIALQFQSGYAIARSTSQSDHRLR